MPEGCECRHQAEALSRVLQGRHITQFEFLQSSRYRSSLPFGFEKVKFPIRVSEVGVLGKLIFFAVKQENIRYHEYIWNTLGMAGEWSLQETSNTRAIVTIDDWVDKVYYNDARNFGTFHFNKSVAETDKKLETLGFDLLNEIEPDAGHLIFARNKNKKKTLAEILMSQTDYCGIGNYLKAEILYRAKLSPHRLGESLSSDEINLLDKCISSTMMESYQAKPAGFSNYQESSFKKVIYKQSHCSLGHEIKAETTKDGRTTYWCPNEQK